MSFTQFLMWHQNTFSHFTSWPTTFLSATFAWKSSLSTFKWSLGKTKKQQQQQKHTTSVFLNTVSSNFILKNLHQKAFLDTGPEVFCSHWVWRTSLTDTTTEKTPKAFSRLSSEFKNYSTVWPRYISLCS